MRDARYFAAFAALKRTAGPAARLSTTASSSTAAPLLAFSLTARRPPPPPTAAAGLSAAAAAAAFFLLRSVVTLPSASAAGTIAAAAFFVTATAAATAVASAPHAAALVSPQHSHVFACGIAPVVKWFDRKATEIVLPDELKLRRRGRFPPRAGPRETADSSSNSTKGTASVTRASPVTRAFRKEEHASSWRGIGTSEVSCSAAAAKHHRAEHASSWRGIGTSEVSCSAAAAKHQRNYKCTAGSKCGRSAAETRASRAVVETSRVGAFKAISRGPFPAEYSFFCVWKHLQESGAACLSWDFSTRGVCRRYIPPCALPCPAVLKPRLRHFCQSSCESNSRPSSREGAFLQRCVSGVVAAQSSSSFRLCWPLFTACVRSCTEQLRRLAGCRPLATRLFLHAFTSSRTSSAESASARRLPQPLLSRESQARLRQQLSRLWYAYLECSSGLQLGSRRLNSRRRRVYATRSELHSCCGSLCSGNTDVRRRRSGVTYCSARTCVAEEDSAAVDVAGARENCSSRSRSSSSSSNAFLRRAGSRGSSRSCTAASWNRSAGRDACPAKKARSSSSSDEYVAGGRKQQGRRVWGFPGVPSCAFLWMSCRPGHAALPSVSSRGKKTAGPRKTGQHLTVSIGFSDTMEVSLASAGTQDARLEDVTLKLEAHEQQLFDMLTQCVRDEKLDIVLRAAGGWVRDKLLNRRSDDIDIVIDKMTGVQFAGALNRWLVAQGLPSHAVGVVASNPEQSKHLETATCRLLGRFQVDFVHLRTETYSQGSRIPQAVAFGSPEEDASRRDFTINALFYNVHTRKVEDFTGLGLQDLRSGLLRTPLPDAEATLLDDPLRVLRGVRFASRFGFRLHPDFIHAAQLETVRNALLSKVSRERIGVEVKKMLTGPSGKKTGTNEPSDGCLTEVPAEASPRNVTAVTPPQKDVDSGASVQQSMTRRTTETEEQSHGEATAGLGECTDRARVAFRTAQVEAEDTDFLKRIAAASRSVREALLLLVHLRVVSCVFRLPEQVIAPSISVDAELFSKRPPHEEGQLVPCERDLHLKEWWVHGLRCIYALTTWLEHYFEKLAGTDETQKDKDGRTESAVDVQFRKLMEQGNASFINFTDHHFRTLVLGCFLFPMAGRFCLNDKLKREKLLNFLIVSSLKLSRKDADQVVLLVEGARAFLREIANDTGIRVEKNEELTRTNTQVAPELQDRRNWTDNSMERVRLGLLIRSVGPSWPQALLLAAAALQTECASCQADGELAGREYLGGTTDTRKTLEDTPSDKVFPYNGARSIKRGRTPSMEDVEPDGDPKEKGKETAAVEELAMQAACAPLREQSLARILLLQQKIKQAGIEDAWKLQPLHDGRAVKNLLPKLSKGPIFKEIQEEQVRWQLANPSKTHEDCALHLRKMFKEFL